MTDPQSNDKHAARQSLRDALNQSRARAASVPQPPQIRYAMIATAAQLLLGVIAAALSWGFTDKLTTLLTRNHKDVITNWAKDNYKGPATYPFSTDLINAYNKAHSKSTWQDFCSATNTKDCFDVSHALHSFRLQLTLTTIVSALLIVLLWARIRRGSGGARWGYLAVCTVGAFVGLPLTILYIGNFASKLPKPIGLAQSLSSLACVVAVVLLVIRPSANYFRATREASGKPAGFGGRRPGGLLGGLMQPPAGEPRAAKDSASNSSATSVDPTAGKAKAKVRSADTSAAKGAELARARAKASKSKSRKNPDPTR